MSSANSGHTAPAPRKVSSLRMMASAVTALLRGQKIEFSGKGSREMQRRAIQATLSLKAGLNPTLISRGHPPVWTGKMRPRRHAESGRITARY